MRERVRVRGQSWIMLHCCPLIRPSATFSLRVKGLAEDQYYSGNRMFVRSISIATPMIPGVETRNVPDSVPSGRNLAK
jgi:hypothetical protein